MNGKRKSYAECYYNQVAILFRIRHTLNDQRLLCDVGPMIPASWGVTSNDFPKPNTTSARNTEENMLFDTGGSGIYLDESVAVRLGLQPHSERQDVHGLGGKHPANMYSAALFLTVETVKPIAGRPAGVSTSIGFLLPTVLGITGLQANYEAHNLRAGNSLPIIGVLGRSFFSSQNSTMTDSQEILSST
jgi:hypothetical protein